MIRDTKDDDQPKIYMCQGPPGTGKSQTITGIVRTLLQVIFVLFSFEISYFNLLVNLIFINSN
jgi:hypothetical protein